MNSMYPKKATALKSPAPSALTDAGASRGRRIQVRRSGIHGKGVFALQPIAAGETILEYTGKVITWKQAQKRPPHNPDEPNHTFFFHIDDKHVIDGGDGGNAAKWINHACGPNCEADEDDEEHRVFIKALRDIEPGEELNYDYGLILEGKHTKEVKEEFACRCGTPECRGTMLAPKKKDKDKKKKKKKS
jgi:SET domain-containing protein